MNSENKNSTSIITLIGSIIIAVVVFIVLINIQGSMVKNIETTKIVVAKKDISKNVEIEVEKFDEYFEIREIPNYCVVDNTFKSLDALRKDLKKDDADTLYISENISKNEQLQQKQFMKNYSPINNLNSPVMLGFKVSTFDYGVGGIIREGDLIDIYSVNGVTGVEKCVGEDVYVVKVMDSTGKEINIDDKTSLAVAFNVAVEQAEQDTFMKGLEEGTIRISKKNDITE